MLTLKNISQILIYFHAGFGGIALLLGTVALIAKKGKSTHKTSGKIFFYTMMISAISALIIATLPEHENTFLFSIGIFSAYFLITGKRSLKFKYTNTKLITDKIIAYFIIINSIIMLLYPIIILQKINIVLPVFGIIGLIFGIRDLILLKKPKTLQRKWLQLHIGKMTGGYIAAISAFFVVNQILPGIWNWFVPSAFGSIYISFWINKTKKKNTNSLKN